MKPGEIVYQGKTKSGKDLTICYISRKNTQALLDFINKLSTERTFILFQGEQLTLEEENKHIEDKVKKIKERKIVHLIAFVDGEMAGGSDIGLKDKVKTHQASFGIAIAKDFRGDGIGKILMKQVLKEAKKNLKGLKIIDLEVFGNNLIAHNLYKKMGFKEYGLLPKGIKHRGEFVDQVLMYKKI